jgi:hypothetical protein
MRSAGPGDDQTRFLADLRALRDTAAIGYDELAARTHYPSDALKEAEHGPRLPSLPILVAYVRACEGNVPEWEERWRRLRDETRADPNLPVRPAGASPAAVAGARAGIGVSPPEAYDPDRIRAALRGNQGRPSQTTRHAEGPGTPDTVGGLGTSEMASGLGTLGAETSDLDAGLGAGAGWESVAGQGVGGVGHPEGWAGETAERTRVGQDDQFSAWLRDREPALQAGDETFSWLEPNRSAPPTHQTPQGRQAPQIPQVSWTPSGTQAPAEPANGGLATARPAAVNGLADVTGPAGGPAGVTGSAGVRVTIASQPARQRSRAFSLRLLMVVIVAALLGSVLMVILLR